MVTLKISELEGQQLDYAVTAALGVDMTTNWPYRYVPEYSSSWSLAGPIIEREIFKLFRNVGGAFTAQIKTRVPYFSPTYNADIGTDKVISCAGSTPLIAAMRCYVASKLGDEVDIPEELI